jgi:hypothetical protein
MFPCDLRGTTASPFLNRVPDVRPTQSTASVLTVYRPTVAALQDLAPKDAVVLAPPEFRFAYRGPFLFDVRLGFVSKRSVPAIAVDKEYLNVTLAWARDHNPALLTYLQQLMQHTCSIQYENEKYAIYSCAPPAMR